MLRAALIALAVVGSTEARRLVDLDQTAHGNFVWHGHSISAPYVASLGYRLGPDTVWTGAYINGLPLGRLREPRPPAIGPSFQQSAALMESTMTRSFAAARLRKGQEPGLVYGIVLAEELRSHPEAVDSVTASSGTELLIHWKGVSKPMRVSVGRLEPTPTPTSRTTAMGLRAQLEGVLREDGLVIVSNGTLYVPAGASADYLSEIDSLRRGFDPIGRRIHGSMLAEVRCPEPLDSLRAREP